MTINTTTAPSPLIGGRGFGLKMGGSLEIHQPCRWFRGGNNRYGARQRRWLRSMRHGKPSASWRGMPAGHAQISCSGQAHRVHPGPGVPGKRLPEGLLKSVLLPSTSAVCGAGTAPCRRTPSPGDSQLDALSAEEGMNHWNDWLTNRPYARYSSRDSPFSLQEARLVGERTSLLRLSCIPRL